MTTLLSFLPLRRFALALTASSLTLIAAPALAEDAGRPTDGAPPKAPARGGDDLLRGPSVADDAHRKDQAFGKSGLAEKARRGGEQPGRSMAKVRLWMETMRQMDLSPTQREQVDAIVARVQDARAAFEKAHGEDRRALEKTIKENGPGTAAGQEARQKMKEIAGKAPRPEPFQEEAFALLTPAQQETFRKNLAEREAQLEARQRDRRGGMEGMRDGATGPPRGRSKDSGKDAGKGAQGDSGKGAEGDSGKDAGGAWGKRPAGRGALGAPEGKGSGERQRPQRDRGNNAAPPPVDGDQDDPMR
jgi:Spy/CpxP family protein refolding chaperone